MTERRYTLEIRVDYTDEGKFAAVIDAMRSCARQVLATAALLRDGVKPQIAIWSDDMFTGTEEISLFADTVGEGMDKLNTLAGTPDAGEEAVDPELIAALRRSQEDDHG